MAHAAGGNSAAHALTKPDTQPPGWVGLWMVETTVVKQDATFTFC